MASSEVKLDISLTVLQEVTKRLTEALQASVAEASTTPADDQTDVFMAHLAGKREAIELMIKILEDVQNVKLTVSNRDPS